MASLNVESLRRKLHALQNTQDSIQTLSLWIIHHKNHYRQIVEEWIDASRNMTKVSRRLTLLYLANDVLQNSKRKGATVFLDAFAEVLEEAASLCKDESIRKSVLRIVNIWEERNIYENDFCEKLITAIVYQKKAVVKPKPVANTKILAEYKPKEVPQTIEELMKFEAETILKCKQLNSMNVDVTNTETITKLKDRAGGKQFSKQFDEAATKLEDYVQSLTKEVEMRRKLNDLLDNGEIFYEAQNSEAKIVTNAYKNFGTRVNSLKKRLDEYKKLLPDPTTSPLPSPASDAPSPGATPPRDPNADTVEVEDMELSDEDAKHPGTIIAAAPVRSDSRRPGQTKAMPALPTDPAMSSKAADSYTPPGSPPSPEGSPIALSPPSLTPPELTPPDEKRKKKRSHSHKHRKDHKRDHHHKRSKKDRRHSTTASLYTPSPTGASTPSSKSADSKAEDRVGTPLRDELDTQQNKEKLIKEATTNPIEFLTKLINKSQQKGKKNPQSTSFINSLTVLSKNVKRLEAAKQAETNFELHKTMPSETSTATATTQAATPGKSNQKSPVTSTAASVLPFVSTVAESVEGDKFKDHLAAHALSVGHIMKALKENKPPPPPPPPASSVGGIVSQTANAPLMFTSATAPAPPVGFTPGQMKPGAPGGFPASTDVHIVGGKPPELQVLGINPAPPSQITGVPPPLVGPQPVGSVPQPVGPPSQPVGSAPQPVGPPLQQVGSMPQPVGLPPQPVPAPGAPITPTHSQPPPFSAPSVPFNQGSSFPQPAPGPSPEQQRPPPFSDQQLGRPPPDQNTEPLFSQRGPPPNQNAPPSFPPPQIAPNTRHPFPPLQDIRPPFSQPNTNAPFPNSNIRSTTPSPDIRPPFSQQNSNVPFPGPNVTTPSPIRNISPPFFQQNAPIPFPGPNVRLPPPSPSQDIRPPFTQHNTPAPFPGANMQGPPPNDNTRPMFPPPNIAGGPRPPFSELNMRGPPPNENVRPMFPPPNVTGGPPPDVRPPFSGPPPIQTTQAPFIPSGPQPIVQGPYPGAPPRDQDLRVPFPHQESQIPPGDKDMRGPPPRPIFPHQDNTRPPQDQDMRAPFQQQPNPSQPPPAFDQDMRQPYNPPGDQDMRQSFSQPPPQAPQADMDMRQNTSGLSSEKPYDPAQGYGPEQPYDPGQSVDQNQSLASDPSFIEPLPDESYAEYLERYNKHKKKGLIKTQQDSQPYKQEDQFTSKPQDSYGSKLLDQFGSKPQDQFGNKPQDQFGNKPQDQFGNKPQDQFGSNTHNQYGSKPQDQYGSKPQDQFGRNTHGQFGSRLQDQFGSNSHNQFGSKPQDQFGNKPQDMFGSSPHDQFNRKPQDQYSGPQRVNLAPPVQSQQGQFPAPSHEQFPPGRQEPYGGGPPSQPPPSQPQYGSPHHSEAQPIQSLSAPTMRPRSILKKRKPENIISLAHPEEQRPYEDPQRMPPQTQNLGVPLPFHLLHAPPPPPDEPSHSWPPPDRSGPPSSEAQPIKVLTSSLTPMRMQKPGPPPGPPPVSAKRMSGAPPPPPGPPPANARRLGSMDSGMPNPDITEDELTELAHQELEQALEMSDSIPKIKPSNTLVQIPISFEDTAKKEPPPLTSKPLKPALKSAMKKPVQPVPLPPILKSALKRVTQTDYQQPPVSVQGKLEPNAAPVMVSQSDPKSQGLEQNDDRTDSPISKQGGSDVSEAGKGEPSSPIPVLSNKKPDDQTVTSPIGTLPNRPGFRRHSENFASGDNNQPQDNPEDSNVHTIETVGQRRRSFPDRPFDRHRDRFEGRFTRNFEPQFGGHNERPPGPDSFRRNNPMNRPMDMFEDQDHRQFEPPQQFGRGPPPKRPGPPMMGGPPPRRQPPPFYRY